MKKIQDEELGVDQGEPPFTYRHREYKRYVVGPFEFRDHEMTLNTVKENNEFLKILSEQPETESRHIVQVDKKAEALASTSMADRFAAAKNGQKVFKGGAQDSGGRTDIGGGDAAARFALLEAQARADRDALDKAQAEKADNERAKLILEENNARLMKELAESKARLEQIGAAGNAANQDGAGQTTSPTGEELLLQQKALAERTGDADKLIPSTDKPAEGVTETGATLAGATAFSSLGKPKSK